MSKKTGRAVAWTGVSASECLCYRKTIPTLSLMCPGSPRFALDCVSPRFIRAVGAFGVLDAECPRGPGRTNDAPATDTPVERATGPDPG